MCRQGLEVCQQVFGYILIGAGSMPIWVGCILTGVWKYADMGWMYTDRVWKYADMGWMYTDRCLEVCQQVFGYILTGVGSMPTGV